MPHRPLALVSVLALSDYMLWNWSLGAHHDVWALVSGLTLPPLALACLWLLAVTLGHALAHARRRTRESLHRRGSRMTDAQPDKSAGPRASASPVIADSTPEAAPVSSSARSTSPAGSPAAARSSAAAVRSSGKLAA